MSAPVTIRLRVQEILATQPNESVELVCRELLNRLPVPYSGLRGKKCPHCQFKMPCRQLRCPNCCVQVGQKTTYNSRPSQPQVRSLTENECNVCGSECTASHAYGRPCRLSCGHVYHKDCLMISKRMSGPTCVHCPDVQIPEQIPEL